MSKNIRVIKGKVIVEDRLDSEVEEVIKSKYKNKPIFEFWRIKHSSLQFLAGLQGLEDLSLINVKLEDASGIANISALNRLFLNGVKISSGFGFLADLRHIEELHLLNLTGDLVFPDLGRLDSLRRIRVWSCKKYSDVSILENTPNVEDVEFVDTALEPDDLLPLLKKESIEYVNAQFRTKKQNDIFSEYLVRFNKKQFRGV